MHIWDLRRRKHRQTIDLGKEQQMVLELRPSHDPTRTFGFVGVVVSLKDLSASIWLWKRDNGSWSATKVIEIPAEPAEPDLLPPLLKGFKAVPPLVTDINLSLDESGSTSPAGAPENFAVTMFGTGSPETGIGHSDRRDRPQSVSSERAECRAQRRPADGEVSRDGNGSISPTRSMHLGTNNFIRTASDLVRPGGRRAGRIADTRSELSGDVGGTSAAPGATGRRRHIVGFILLSIVGEEYSELQDRSCRIGTRSR